MRKLIIIAVVAVIAFMACQEPESEASQAILVIRNQTFSEITNVIWNGVPFGSIGIGGVEERSVPTGTARITFRRTQFPIDAETQTAVSLGADQRQEFNFLNTTEITQLIPGSPSGTFGSLGVSAPTAPTGVTATAQSTSVIQISWNAVASATSYRVEFATSASGTWSVAPGAQAVTGTSTVHSGLSEGTTRWYRVIAVNLAGDSSPSQVVSATTALALPAAPTGVTARVTERGQITINWNAVTGATSYRVYYAQASFTDPSTQSWVSAKSVTGTSVVHVPDFPTTWFYRVIAVNADGESPLSQLVSATISWD